MQVAGQIGERKLELLKEAQDFDFVDPAREAQVIKRLQDLAGADLPAAFVSRLYRRDHGRGPQPAAPGQGQLPGPGGDLQPRGRAAALRRRRPSWSRRTASAPAPTPSSTTRPTTPSCPTRTRPRAASARTLALLLETRACAPAARTQLRVRQHLLGRAGQDLAAVRRVYSHPQVLRAVPQLVRGQPAGRGPDRMRLEQRRRPRQLQGGGGRCDRPRAAPRCSTASRSWSRTSRTTRTTSPAF